MAHGKPPPIITDAAELQRLRVEAGLSVADLTARSNVTSSTIYRLENGERASAQMKTLRALAEALGVEVSDLVAEGGDGRAAGEARPRRFPPTSRPATRYETIALEIIELTRPPGMDLMGYLHRLQRLAEARLAEDGEKDIPAGQSHN